MKSHHRTVLDNFFNTSSRFIMLVPIILFLLAVILKFSEGKNKTESYVGVPTQVKSINSPVPSISLQQNKSQQKLSLEGPLRCVFETQNASVSALVQQKKIFIISRQKTLTSFYLYRDDCVYSWENTAYTGKKLCGLGQLVNWAENMFNLGLLSNDMISSFINQLKEPEKQKKEGIDFISVLSQCKKSPRIPEKEFDIPKQILFKTGN